MAKITNKNDLVVNTNMFVDEPNRTVAFVEAGGLDYKDGVGWQAFYSKIVDLWTLGQYQDSPFPLYAIDALSGQYQIGTDGATFNGWTFLNDNTRNALRDGGWDEFSNTGVLLQQFAAFIGLGAINSGAQPYYHLDPSDAPVDFPFDDQFNVGIKVFGDATHGNFDKRSYAKTFVREQGKKYKSSVLADTGATGTGANKVNFLLANEDDLKIQAGDGDMGDAPYSGITVSYYTLNQPRSVGGVNYNFKVIIDGNNATLEQIYTKIQYLLRQTSNINTAGTAGNVTGKTASDLLTFVGDTLQTGQSVYVDNIQNADSNRIEFRDDGGTFRLNPFESSGLLQFNSVLVGAGSSYRMLYASPPGAGNDYGEAGAVTVNDASGTPITGTISAGTIDFTYDYDGNTQAGFTAGTDRAVVLVGIRPGSGKFVSSTGTLTKSKSLIFSLVAENDRVYA